MFDLQSETQKTEQVHSSTAEPDRFQSVQVSILGRYMLADYSEFPCQVIEMSPGSATLIAPSSGDIGERVIAYLDAIGRIDGTITEIIDGGFNINFSASFRKRDKIAAQLTWIANKEILDLKDERDHGRYVPDFRHSAITMSDGRRYNCKIIDISISGAAIELSVRPAIGSVVNIGRMQAKVMRHFENGIGVQFATEQEMIRVVQQNLRLD